PGEGVRRHPDGAGRRRGAAQGDPEPRHQRGGGGAGQRDGHGAELRGRGHRGVRGDRYRLRDVARVHPEVPVRALQVHQERRLGHRAVSGQGHRGGSRRDHRGDEPGRRGQHLPAAPAPHAAVRDGRRPAMTTATTAERARWLRATWAWLLPPWIAALALYAPLVPGLVYEWSEFPSLSHGFAIPFIAGYLIWARRDEIRARALAPSAWGFPVLAAGLLVFAVGMRASEPFVARMSLPVILLGLSLLVAGFAITRATWPGIAYLLFMIPLPWGTVKQVTYRSRLFDADASAMFLRWMGVPVYHDGVMLHLPNVNLEVADACSSIPAIAALLSLGVAYAVV